MLIFAGIFSLFIWGILTLITRGIAPGIYEKVVVCFPEQLQPYLAKIQNGFYYDVENQQMPAEVFFVLFSLAFFIYLFVILRIRRQKNSTNNFLIIFLFGILFRLVLIPSVMIHENDIYRYIWDGKVSLAGVNPYKHAPEMAEIEPAEPDKYQEFLKLKELKNQNPVFFDRIGFRDVPTIYPPVAQGLFALATLLGRDSIAFMKLIFVIFDTLTIFLIYKLLLRFNMKPNMVIVYAWSPLVLKEFANSGHCGVLAVTLLIASLFFLLGNKKNLSVLSLALGGLSKFFPWVIAPIIFKKIRLKSFLFGAGLVSAIYIPFFIWSHTGIAAVFKGLLTYSKEWAIDAAVFQCLYSFLGLFFSHSNFNFFLLTKFFLGFCYLIILIIIVRKNENSDIGLLNKIFWSLAWLFLLSPVGNPWYFCWLIPFLCFFPYRSFILLSGLLIFNYLSFTRNIGELSLGNFSIGYVTLLQYIVFFPLLLRETILKPRKEAEVNVLRT